MKELDPGHSFDLQCFDGVFTQTLVFMKRMGEKYPNNTSIYPGTNLQEVLRALISRVKYLQKQIPCFHNLLILFCLRVSFNLLELRAAQRHKRKFKFIYVIELLPFDSKDGHIRYD